MTVNVQMLKGRMIENGFDAISFSSKIGINRSTFYRKLQAKGLTFTVGEVHKIVEALHLSNEETACIFLFKNSQ